MYTAFYGLREKPFSLTPNPRFLFLSESHREALAHLLYGIEQGEGFIAITGEVGTGKTTICRTLIERLGAETEVAYLFNPSRSARELLETIASEFGLPKRWRSRSELHEDLNRFLLEKKREGRRVLLIVDESQNLSADTLEQVRLLSNLETANSKLIQILLLGQPELDRKLDSEELRQLRQRIGVRWKLSPLSFEETAAYVSHRIRVAAGARRQIFKPAALREVYRRTGGTPRLINVLCDRALLAGYAAQRGEIDRVIVRAAAKELPASGGALPETRSGARAWASGLWSTVAVGIVAVALGAGAATWWIGSRGDDTTSESVAALAASVPPPAVSARPPVSEVLGEPRGVTTVSLLEELRAASPDEPRLDDAIDSSLGLTGEKSNERSQSLEAVAPKLVTGAAPLVEPTEGDVNFLGWALERRTVSEVDTAATNAILSAYGLPALAEPVGSITQMRARFERRGLRGLWIEGGDLEGLRTLNHPAVLELRASDGTTRWVALRHLDGEQSIVVGPLDDEELQIDPLELAEQWIGRAVVVWRQFEAGPELLALGDQGLPVLWLQRSLAELGYFGEEPSGFFGTSTLESVRALQEGHALDPDGAAGPRTQMVLYDLLSRYPLPRLVERGSNG